jgi:PAS domain S-box-containing protein
VVFEQFDSQNAARVFIATAITGADQTYIGALVAEILPEAIYRIMYNTNPGSGMGKTGEAYLVGPEGLMRSPSRFVEGAVLNVPVQTEGFSKAADGQEGVAIYRDYRGVEILGAYGSLDLGGVKRIILAEIDSDEAMVPLAAIRNEILFLSLIIAVVIFMAAWFVAYGITRPLVRLKNAANFISLGNYDQQLEINDNDEIGELTRAFNAMSLEINSTTKELREKEERLRHFYRATLDGIVLHLDDRMLLFNSAMLDLTGYPENELSEFRLSDFLQVEKGADCNKDREPRTFESVLIRKDGSGLQVEIQESCVDYDGKSVRASVIRDISARKKMEAELEAERNKRIRAVFDGQDLERQRLSRELHDGLGQQLVAGKLILESSLYATNSDDFKPKISDAQGIFDRIISDIRRISHDLSPSVLHEFGLRAAIENLCNDISKASGIAVDFQFELDDKNPDEMTATYLYRIAQEGLNNIHRHSGASQARVVLQTDKYGIQMKIEDDGAGFLAREVSKKGGNGLYNIRERVSILKGHIVVKSSPGKGTQILIRVPFNS